MRDMLSNKTAIKLADVTLSGTAAGATAAVDVKGFDAVTLAVETGTVTDAGTASGFTVTLQHSDTLTGSDFEDVAATDVVGDTTYFTITADGDDDILVGGMGYVGGKRYLRLNGVGTTGTAATYSARAIMNKPHRAPTTFVGSSDATT